MKKKPGRKIIENRKREIAFLKKTFSFLPKNVSFLFLNFFRSKNGNLAILFRFLSITRVSKYAGNNIYTGSNVILKNTENLEIGNNTSVHDNCYIDAAGGISIGNNVSIAHQTSILSTEHTWQDESTPIKYNQAKFKPTVIENDVWVGCGVRILAGVTIHSRSIIAAGAVVTKDVQSHTVVGGIPAKLIKKLDE